MIFRIGVLCILGILSSCIPQSDVNSGITEGASAVNLYPAHIPGAKNSKDLEYISNKPETNRFIVDVTFPKLTVYIPKHSVANGTAVIILPGGGYKGVAIDSEGIQVAKRFTQIGVTAFVLKYRIPMDQTMDDKSVGPLQDIQQAIHLVRSRAQEWSVDPNKIGAMGFSAGGHLASSAAVHFDKPVNDSLVGKNLRPDFQVLLYPVISFDNKITHQGSRGNLIGPNPEASLVQHYSNELQVTSNTPQAFIVHAGDDKLVPVENSLGYYQALNNHKVASQLLLLPSGGHGFGLNNDYDWFSDLTQWMANANLLAAH